MAKIVECIPNFSEGVDARILEGLADVVRNTSGCTLLDYSGDLSHNRSVYTFIGSVEGVTKCSVALAKFAAENIDLTKHLGEHPRMGAVDVVPFVPIKNVTMDECVEISKTVGREIADTLGIPVFLYEESADLSHRRNLSDVRKGQFENMRAKMADVAWKPDFGPSVPHATAGVVAVGARFPLIAFNVNLSTDDVKIADKIAKIVRGSSGGFSHVKAIGVYLKDRKIAQVSMNFVNFEFSPLYRTVETIRMEAARFGVNIIGTELVGLSSAKALADSAAYYLQIENFDYDKQVLEAFL